MRANAQDVGPFRIDQLMAIWGRIARTAEALQVIGAIDTTHERLAELVTEAKQAGSSAFDHFAMTKVLRVLALQDNMHAADWLRMKAVEAELPRRKPPPALDLQLRLKGLQCHRLVAQVLDAGDATERVRVTIRNVRGDVASVESPSFANALEGAIKMAGARSEMTDEND